MAEIVLVCELADAPTMLAGSTFDRRCGCGRFVMIAPSGQKMLRDATGPVEIVCAICFWAQLAKGRDLLVHLPVKSVEELLHEMQSEQPNLRRYRN